MRTTIEITDHHRSVLLSMAAQRGLRGYSEIIQEAIDKYISEETKKDENKEKVLIMKGSWNQNEAEKIKANIRELREQWNIS